MAHIAKVGLKWRAEVCVDRKRQAKTFPTKREAVAWANVQEQDGILSRHTLAEALEKYKAIAQGHKGYQSELSRIRSLTASCLAKVPLDMITAAKIASWRDERLAQVAPVSVRREMIILSALLAVAVQEWGWLRSNPMATVKKPPTSVARRRGIAGAEIDQIVGNLAPMRAGPQVAQMFRLSLETAMRLGELVALRWPDVSDKTVRLRETKNGDVRIVSLSPAARAIIAERRNIDPETVFTLSAHVASKAFQRASVNGVHFHDARGEAITRLSKKLDVLQLAKMIGHRDPKSLMHYYAESAEDIADRL